MPIILKYDKWSLYSNIKTSKKFFMLNASLIRCSTWARAKNQIMRDLILNIKNCPNDRLNSRHPTDECFTRVNDGSFTPMNNVL